MPLLAPLQTQDTGPSPEPGQEPLPPSTPPATARLSWTPAGGETVDLVASAREGIMLGGVGDPGAIIGLDMPPDEQYDTEYAGDGSLFQGRRALPRPVGLPVVVHADSPDDLARYKRQLMAMFDPRRGKGELTIALPEGTERTLFALYESGLSTGEQGLMGGGQDYDSYVVQLIARDPYLYGETRTVSFRPPDDAFDEPFLPGPPFTIAGPGPGGTRETTIDGEVDTSPVLYMVGPMLTATWTHEGLGVTLELTPNLVAGQTLTVRTGPGVDAQDRFVRDGESVWGEVAGDFPPLLPWILQPGTNRITTTFSGTGEGSDAWIEYRTRYLTA